MTTLPDPNELVTIMGRKIINDTPSRLDVIEQRWGYEVRPTQMNGWMNSLIRLGFYLGSLVFGIVGILALVSPMQGLGLNPSAQWVLAIGSLALAALTAHVSAGREPVRVQVDTKAGELREIMERPFLGTQVLAKYNFDTIAGVEIVTSTKDSSVGQLHARVNGYGVVLVAGGSISALRSLRDRFAVDCGLGHMNARSAA